jgi:uncharacterized membrane protein
MLIAALRDTGYNIVLFLHVLAAVVAVTGSIAHPLMFKLEEQRADGDLAALARRIALPSRIYAISYALAGLIGFGLVSMGDWPWGDAWISISMLLWLVTNGLLHALVLPAERAVAGGDTSAMAKLNLYGPIVTVLVIATVFFMTVKPGGAYL